MSEFTKGSIRRYQKRCQGKDGSTKAEWVWKLVVVEASDDGTRHVRTKVTDIECSPDRGREKGKRAKPTGKGANRALEALDGFRSALMAADEKRRSDSERERLEAEERAKAAADPANEPLADYLDRFIDRRVKGQVIERSTATAYRATAKQIRARLGDLRIADLTPIVVRSLENEMLDRSGDNLSASTVGKVHRLLHLVTRELLDNDVIVKDPMRGVKPPKRVSKNPNAYSFEDVPEVAERLEELNDSPCVVAANLALYGGLRRGEIAALRWQDVDLEGGVITVRSAIGSTGRATYVKATKTDRVRTVPIAPQLHKTLASWRAECQAAALAAGAHLPGLFVCGRPDGTYVDPNVLSRQWKELAQVIGIRGTGGKVPTFHDLRHTFASTAITAGVDVKTVSSILGHANAAMTLNVYATADPEAKKRAAEVLGKAYAPRGGVERLKANGTEGR